MGGVPMSANLRCPVCRKRMTGFKAQTQTARDLGITDTTPDVLAWAGETTYYALPCKCEITEAQFDAFDRAAVQR